MKFTRSWLLFFDVLAVIVAFLLAFVVRVPLRYLGRELPEYIDFLLPLMFIRITCLALFGLYRPIWQWVPRRELVAVLCAVSTGSVVATLGLVLVNLIEPMKEFPRLVLLLEWGLSLALMGGMRYSLRVLDMRLMEPEPEPPEDAHHQKVLKQRLSQWLYDAPPDVQEMWHRSQQLSVKRASKRLFDIVTALIALIALAPVLIFLAVLVKLESPGPILADTPKRAGRGGSEFRMYKFRSMVQNAHMLLVNNPELWEKYKKNNFKLMEDDPRLTRIGRFIRKASLDELPNLFNVLHGEMSMVGPRARYPFEVVAQAERVPHTQPEIIKILSVKPGVTGPFQVGGRSKLTYEQRTRLEARYAETHTLWGDIVIGLQTIPVVARRDGAL